MVDARTRPRVKGNRLVKAQRVVPSVNTTTVATYAYDGLPALDTPGRAKPVIAKRSARVPSGGESRVPSIEKTVTYNAIEETPGDGGNRHEHFFWGGMGVSPVNWRLIETQTHAGSPKALYQVVYGTQYIDEPIRYDRDTNGNGDCLEAEGSAAYYYHQDANYRVVMLTLDAPPQGHLADRCAIVAASRRAACQGLTDESADVVERYRYTAYGEPTVYKGGSTEAGNALHVSTVGNPLMHQRLFRDNDIGCYQNRFRQLHSRTGRFMQRDPLGYVDGMNLYEYVRSTPTHSIDPAGLQFGCHSYRWQNEATGVSFWPAEVIALQEWVDESNQKRQYPDAEWIDVVKARAALKRYLEAVEEYWSAAAVGTIAARVAWYNYRELRWWRHAPTISAFLRLRWFYASWAPYTALVWIQGDNYDYRLQEFLDLVGDDPWLDHINAILDMDRRHWELEGEMMWGRDKALEPGDDEEEECRDGDSSDDDSAKHRGGPGS